MDNNQGVSVSPPKDAHTDTPSVSTPSLDTQTPTVTSPTPEKPPTRSQTLLSLLHLGTILGQRSVRYTREARRYYLAKKRSMYTSMLVMQNGMTSPGTTNGLVVQKVLYPMKVPQHGSKPVSIFLH
jgi:hypothetical protein